MSHTQPYSPPLLPRATPEPARSVWSQIQPPPQQERPSFTFAPAPHLSQPSRSSGPTRLHLDEGSNGEDDEEEEDDDSDESSKSATTTSQAALPLREATRIKGGLPTPKEKERAGAGTSKPDDLAHLRFGNLLAQSTSATPTRQLFDSSMNSSIPRLLLDHTRDGTSQSQRGGASNSPLNQLTSPSNSAPSRAHSAPSIVKRQHTDQSSGNGQASTSTLPHQNRSLLPPSKSTLASRPASISSASYSNGPRSNLAPVVGSAKSLAVEQNGLNSLLGKRRAESHDAGSGRSSVRSLVGSPSPNKRRRDSATAPILAPLQDFVDRTNDEIASLKSQLFETMKKHDIFRAAVKEHVKGVLERSENAKRSMEAAAVEMRAAFFEIRQETGGLVSAQAVKAEIEEMKESLAPFISVDGQMTFEKQEHARVEALKELTNELTKQQGVIDLLRDQLTIKTGEIYEARDRVASLEQASLTESTQINARITTLLAEFEKAIVLHEGLEKELRLARERRAELIGEIEEGKRVAGKWTREKDGLVATIDEAKSKILSMEKAQEITSQTNKDLLLTNDELMLKNQSLSQSILQLTTTADQLKGTTKSAEEVSTKLKASIEALQGDVEREKNATERVKKEKEELLVDLEMGQERERALKRKGTEAESKLEDAKASIEKMKSDLVKLEETHQSTMEEARSKISSLESELKNQRGGASTSSKELQSLRREKVSLEGQLKKAQEERSSLEIRSTESIAELESTREELEATSSKLAEHEKSSGADVSKLKQEIIALKTRSSTFSTLSTSHEEALEQITALETSLATAQNTAQSISVEKDRKIQELEEAKSQTIVESKREALIAFRAAFEKDKADYANQIKRAGNRLAETEKKLQKALTELAIAKNRPMIDPRIADSSPVDNDSSTVYQIERSPFIKQVTSLSAISVQVEDPETDSIAVRASPDDSTSPLITKSHQKSNSIITVTPATSISTSTRSNKRRKSVVVSSGGGGSGNKSGEATDEIEESEDSIVVAKPSRTSKMQKKRK